MEMTKNEIIFALTICERNDDHQDLDFVLHDVLNNYHVKVLWK
jgi:hypothetical protein